MCIAMQFICFVLIIKPDHIKVDCEQISEFNNSIPTYFPYIIIC